VLDWSLIVAVLVVSLVGGAITGAVALALGGMGGIRVLSMRIDEIGAGLERTDERITREVKTRAAEAGVKVREVKSASAQAQEFLADSEPAKPAGRPSVIGR